MTRIPNDIELAVGANAADANSFPGVLVVRIDRNDAAWSRVALVGQLLGDLNDMMVLNGVIGAEMAMRDVGIPLEAGSGVAAASDYLRQTAAPLPWEVSQVAAE